MIGQTIHSRPRFPWGAVLALLVGGGLIVLAIVKHNTHCAIAAVLPLLVSIALWLARPRGFAAHFTETAVEFMDPPLTLPYEHMEGLRVQGRSSDPDKNGAKSFPVLVHHESGVVEIPARLNVPSIEAYRFLLDQFSPSGSREVNSALAEYLTRQVETFGADRVFSYRARNHLGRGSQSRRGQAVSLAVMLAGVIWLIAGFQGKAFEPWIGGGATLLFFGFLSFLLFRLGYQAGPQKIKNWRSASLVISPVGLAVVQADLKGEMRWDELRNVHMKAPKFAVGTSRAELGPGIRLVVEGATIVLADLYDRPLRLIYQRITDYWRP